MLKLWGYMHIAKNVASHQTSISAWFVPIKPHSTTVVVWGHKSTNTCKLHFLCVLKTTEKLPQTNNCCKIQQPRLSKQMLPEFNCWAMFQSRPSSTLLLRPKIQYASIPRLWAMLLEGRHFVWHLLLKLGAGFSDRAHIYIYIYPFAVARYVRTWVR